MKYLEQASLDYGKAIDDRPDEKYFLEPQTRIKTALEHYLQSKTSPPPPPPAPDKPRDDPAVTNEDVIVMVQAQMDEANILDSIKNAPRSI